MNLYEIKEVNPIKHVEGSSKIKEEHPNTFEKQYKMPKYEPKETKIQQLGNTSIYLYIDCQKDIKMVLNKWYVGKIRVSFPQNNKYYYSYE